MRAVYACISCLKTCVCICLHTYEYTHACLYACAHKRAHMYIHIAYGTHTYLSKKGTTYRYIFEK